MAKTCETCETMKRIRALIDGSCAACDCGSHHGCSHVRADDFTLSKRADKGDGRAPGDDRPLVTNLAPDDEDALRKAMSSLFALDPVQLLMVQYIMRGGDGVRLAGFADHLKAVNKRIARYKDSSARATASAMKDAIRRAFPHISPLVGGTINPNAQECRETRGNVPRSARR